MIKDNSRSEGFVELIKVSKTYPPGVHALNEISLSVDRGEVLFLTGISGAGKTTLLRLLCRIEKASKGMVEVDSLDLTNLSRKNVQKLRQRIGMAYQDFKLLPERSVAQNIAISMEVAYKPQSFIRKRTRELLEQLGISDKHSSATGELSRGEQQRVAIARAVANNPDLILADEPTGNLDAETTQLVMNLLKEHNKKGATVIIATHDESIYRNSSHRVIALRSGKIPTTPQRPDHSNEIDENDSAPGGER